MRKIRYGIGILLYIMNITFLLWAAHLIILNTGIDRICIAIPIMVAVNTLLLALTVLE